MVIAACSQKSKELSDEEELFTPNWKSFTTSYKVTNWYKNAKFGIWGTC